MKLTKEQALCLVAFRALRYWRGKGASFSITKPIFHRLRKHLNLKPGTTKTLDTLVSAYEIEQILTKKEIAEMRARIKAEVLLTK